MSVPRRFGRWLLGRRLDVTSIVPTGAVAPPTHELPRAAPVGRRPDKRPGQVWGICCSGGGIRSASYNLGALQVLREHGVLDSADYLASVSGGGYVAAAHYIVTSRTTDRQTFRRRAAYSKGSPEERHFRNHSTYIAPSLPGRVLAFFNLLYGFGMNMLVLGAWLLVAAKVVAVLYHYWLFDPPETTCFRRGVVGPCTLTYGRWLTLTAMVLAGAGLGLIAIERIWDHYAAPRQAGLELLRAWSFRLFVVAVAFAGLFLALPWLLVQVNQGAIGRGALGFIDAIRDSQRTELKWAAPLAAAAALAATSAWRLIGSRGRSKLALAGVALIGPALLLIPFAAWVNDTALVGMRWPWKMVGFAATGIFVGLVGDTMRWSLHPFYRERLASTFAVRRIADDQAEPLDYTRPIRLSEMAPERTPGLPKLIVCAAANVSDHGITPPGRNAVSFVFSHDESGIPALAVREPGAGAPAACMVDTKTLEEQAGARNLTLPAMVAISGAAISPSMGRMTIRPLRFLMGLMNIRLGVWVPNPLHRKSWAKPPGWKSWFGVGRAGVGHLVREMLGINSFRHKFLYVTDGGHVENLGLVELLRRRCTVIFCFDAAGDPVDEFNTIGEAIAMARSDLGVEFDFRPERLRPLEGTPWSVDDWVLAPFRYRDGTPGLLGFAKAAVIEEAPWDIRAYRLEDDRFPNHSTADQLFDDRQFEAYRALGRFTATRLVRGVAQALDVDPEFGGRPPAAPADSAPVAPPAPASPG